MLSIANKVNPLIFPAYVLYAIQTCIIPTRGGSTGPESVALVRFIDVDHGGSWWVMVALRLRIIVDRQVWSPGFCGFFFFWVTVIGA